MEREVSKLEVGTLQMVTKGFTDNVILFNRLELPLKRMLYTSN